MAVLLSGKRKSGKDHATALLLPRLRTNGISVWHGCLAHPIKRAYADAHGLDFERMLDSSAYKEKWRREMVAWGIEQRKKDPNVFCREVVKFEEALAAHVWLISDARRPSDIEYFVKRCSRDQTVLVSAPIAFWQH